MARIFPNDTSTFNSALKGTYYCDENANSVKDAGEVNVNIWSQLTADGVTLLKGQSCPTVKPNTQAPVDFSTLYDYGTVANLQQKADNTMAGQMRDCAECHVGGGAMEYIPMAQGTDLTNNPSRQDLRSATLAGVNTFNYFIDQYDEDGDGVLGEVLAQDYAVTGVLEMDCLMCHMEGYSWRDRTDAIRVGQFDASRVVGAGLGTALSGTTVAYDATGTMIENSGGQRRLSALALSNIKAAPPNENCSSCHFDMHQVDWKKRGTSWADNYQNEVHSVIGCMGCHTRQDGLNMDPNAAEAAAQGWDGKGSSTVLGHDPSKGVAPYSSLWNKNDGGVVTCTNCHIDQIAGNYGAVDPTPVHTQMGLTYDIIQDGRDGVRDASHLDIITCAACHTRKLGHGPTAAEGGHTHGSLYEWGTGGAMVDSTGPDAEGRLTDHENLYVERTMENNLALAWQGNKLIPTNALVTMFWRDKDDNFANGGDPAFFDVNGDGQTGAMDPVNPSHLRNIMADAGLHTLTHDGVIDDAEIAAQQAALYNALSEDIAPADGISDMVGTPLSATFSQGKLKLSFMGVMFKANHNVSPASYAWGSGGCTDCHSPSGGFYNGTYDLAPRDLNANWDNTSPTGENKWVVPFTKVNMADYDGDGATVPVGSEKADYQFTDFHPTLFAKGQKGRSIALVAAHGGTDGIRAIDRSEALWETNLTPTDPNGVVLYDGSITGTDGNNYTTRQEWVDYLNDVDGAHGTHIMAAVTDCATCHTDVSTADFSITTTGPVTSWDGVTCASTCHGDAGWTSGQSNIVSADFSALASMEIDLEVTLDASRATCYSKVYDSMGIESTVERECSYVWNFDGGNLEGCNAKGDVCTVTYPAAGTYSPSLTMAYAGTSDTQSVNVDATIVEDPVPTVDFATAVVGNTVTLTGTLDASVVRAYVYWGDRRRTVISNMADFTAGIDHTYGRAGSYNIRVQTIDSSYTKLNWTFNEDGDLTVVIP